jgi:hypothetical protein
VHYDAAGRPYRKCDTVLRKLRQCPGRPQEEVASHREEVIDSNLEQDASTQPSPTPRATSANSQQEPVTTDVGELWEAFLDYALNLQQQLSPEDSMQLSPEPQARPQPYADSESAQLEQAEQQRSQGWHKLFRDKGKHAGPSEAVTDRLQDRLAHLAKDLQDT